MLTPAKHLDLDRSLLRVSSEILAELRRRRIVPLEKIRAYVKRRVGDDADVIVLPALSFLFLLGKLDYREKNDSLEYLSG